MAHKCLFISFLGLSIRLNSQGSPKELRGLSDLLHRAGSNSESEKAEAMMLDMNPPLSKSICASNSSVSHPDLHHTVGWAGFPPTSSSPGHTWAHIGRLCSRHLLSTPATP